MKIKLGKGSSIRVTREFENEPYQSLSLEFGVFSPFSRLVAAMEWILRDPSNEVSFFDESGETLLMLNSGSGDRSRASTSSSPPRLALCKSGCLALAAVFRELACDGRLSVTHGQEFLHLDYEAKPFSQKQAKLIKTIDVAIWWPTSVGQNESRSG